MPLTLDDVDGIRRLIERTVRQVIRQELARALHPSVRLEITADPARFDAYVSRPANDPEQPDEPPPPNHAA